MSDLNKFKEIVDYVLEIIWGSKPEPKRARGKKGKYLADDKSTAYTNEAWVGGKAPKKRKKK